MANTTTTTSTDTGGAREILPNSVNGMELRMVKLDDIIIPEDRHERRSRQHIGELRSSMESNGLDTPLLVSPDGDGKYRLVAGGGRLKNAREIGWTEIHALVKVRDAKAEAASTAIENIAREGLSPAEEADAIELMLNAGYSRTEAASRVGLKGKARTSRMALVELPESLRAAFHKDGLPPTLAVFVKTLYDGNKEIGEAIGAIAQKDPVTIGRALKAGPHDLFRCLDRLYEAAGLPGQAPFVATVHRGDAWHRRFDWGGPEDPGSIELSGEAADWFIGEWNKQPESWNRLKIELSEEDVDAAVAVDAAFYEKGEVGGVWIHDRAWLTSHVNDYVLPRMKKEAQARQANSEDRAGRGHEDVSGMPVDKLAQKLERRFLRDIKSEAHSANLDLGSALLRDIGSLKLDRDTALFFAYEVLGRPSYKAIYGKTDTRARVFSECLARVMPGWPTVETKKYKNGKTKETIIYLDGESAEQKMWEFIEGAKTPQEIFGRVVTVFAAASHFRRECGPNGSTPTEQHPSNDVAQKALERILKPHIPASIKRVKTKRRRYNATTEAERQIQETASETNESNDTTAAVTPNGAAKSTASKRAGSKETQVLSLIKANPGVSIPHLAAQMGIKQNYLYRLLPSLEIAGKFHKNGRGWHLTSGGTKTTRRNTAKASIPSTNDTLAAAA